jgi:hypothetical protein
MGLLILDHLMKVSDASAPGGREDFHQEIFESDEGRLRLPCPSNTKSCDFVPNDIPIMFFSLVAASQTL